MTLVEFSDYQCPFCGGFFSATLSTLKRDYIDTGSCASCFGTIRSIRFIRRRARPPRPPCAGDQGKYWQMHDRLFQNQNALTPEQLSEHARTLGLDGAAFDTCLNRASKAERVQKASKMVWPPGCRAR